LLGIIYGGIDLLDMVEWLFIGTSTCILHFGVDGQYGYTISGDIQFVYRRSIAILANCGPRTKIGIDGFV
jgi:hypothetical protein